MTEWVVWILRQIRMPLFADEARPDQKKSWTGAMSFSNLRRVMLKKLAKSARRFMRHRGSVKVNNPKGERPLLLDKLIEDKPQFHLHNGSLTNSWSVHPDTLRFIYSLLTPGATTLETGCGQTTVVFAIAGAKHTCVMPDAGEAERVQEYCAKLGLANNITFVIESSDVALPSDERIPSKLDFVLIDGAHAFPAPIIDWHYTARKLKIGGILAVDDYRMPSVQVLHSFLCTEDEWETVRTVRNTAFFRKLQEPKALVHWNGQKINAAYPGY